MWSRVVEVMLGLWLALSPFIFQHPDGATWYWINDFSCAVLIIGIALLSYRRPLRHAHFAQLAVAVWLIGVGYLMVPYPTPPALQNQIVIGMLLMMFGVIPNNAGRAPEAWQKFNQRAGEN